MVRIIHLMHLRMMDLGLHHSRSGRDECTLYFFHLLFTWWWTLIYLWCTCGLWWICGFIWMDLSTYYYICDIYCDGCDMGGWMCGWMRYICDGWDIYVIYVCMNVFVMMECKKNFCRFGSLCRVLHSAKDPFAECNGHSTRQSWKNGRPENKFSSFAECNDHDTRQRNF